MKRALAHDGERMGALMHALWFVCTCFRYTDGCMYISRSPTEHGNIASYVHTGYVRVGSSNRCMNCY